jgi:uncharacterized protein YgfB (UPF0149 family)
MADLTALALNSVVSVSASELHGVVCGLAVGGERESIVQGLVDLIGADALTDQHSVEAFVDASFLGMMADDMSFALLLPDDDADFTQQLDGVAEWCSGFLSGFAAGLSALGAETLDVLPEEIREIVADFSAITEIDVETREPGDLEQPNEGADIAEGDLMQIEEFVKVGVLLILSLLEHHRA